MGSFKYWLILFFFLGIGLVFIGASDIEDDSSEDFVGLDSSAGSGSFGNARSDPPPKKNTFDEILMDESVSISLSCERTLGSSEDALKSFVMKSLDFTAEETLADLERPACRAFFDRNGNFLTKEQVRQLMESERGRRILENGEVLEFFSDFSDFSLEHFNQFPGLQISKIRDLSSISANVLLTLLKQRGFQNAGRLERLPEAFGERILQHESWLRDPEIWQLFTLEGIAQIHSIETVQKFSNFLANRERFEMLIYRADSDGFDFAGIYSNYGVEESNETKGPEPALSNQTNQASLNSRVRSFTITSESSQLSSTLPTTKTSVPLCRSFARNSNLLARWCVQTEELMLYMVEMSDFNRRNGADLASVQGAIRELIKTRNWLKSELFDRCAGVASLSNPEILKIGVLKALIESPMSWRLKEALRSPSEPTTRMTGFLKSRLDHFPSITEFYRHAAPISNEYLLTHFFLANGIDELGAVFEATQEIDNEKLVLSIAIRRVLFSLLSPTSESSDVIQDALNYVLSAQSPLLATSDSTEIVRWFRQAQDLQAIPVLDQLIRNFGHEFDVSREVKAVLSDPGMREKLFVEAQSSYVRMLAALANGLSVHLTSPIAPRSLVSPYLDPLNALLKTPVQPLPIIPGRRPWTEAEITARSLEIDQVNAHNSSIATFLQFCLSFLKSCVAGTGISRNFSGFMQLNFRINFADLVGIDAGGLRRTWLSAVFRVFGDSQRQLFPLHLKSVSGRTPSALLDPEIMAILGALHGKALQVGVKPDWFFCPLYTHQLLYAAEAPSTENLLQLTEEMYPGILGSFDLIMLQGNESEAVEYFNASGFPTIEGLSPAIAENESIVTSSDDDSTVAEATAPVTPTANSSFSIDSDDDSFIVDVTHELSIDEAGAYSPSPSPQTVPQLQPLRHSFSRMLVFDVRCLLQPSIYPGPRHSVTSLQEIAEYRASLLQLFAQNLMAGRKAYWRTFGIFFEDRFRSQLEAQFLHGLLEPPLVTIEQIMTRINFHRECDAIFLIDDLEEGELEEDEEDSKQDIDPGVKKQCLDSSSNPTPASLNVSARAALTRILLTFFDSPEKLAALLSFATGCPQVPPAGLDALRISIHCVSATSAASKLSKSHTCSNTIDFYASLGLKVTKEAFLESVLSSSGFGFD